MEPSVMKLERVWAMPNKNTFDIKPIKELILSELTAGVWIDPFANRNKIATITNDLNVDYDTDYHLDALDFLKMFDDNSVDGILYDPPYSPRQVSECYNNFGMNVTWDTTKASFWGNHKREISRIVKKGGKVITFGWNSGGIGMKYGFNIERILMVPHGGWHNDTICTVEIKSNDIILKQERKLEGNTMDHTMTNIDKSIIEKFNQLPENYWDFKDVDNREFTHGIHTYPAVMVSPISRNIIRILHESGYFPTSLLDPYMGSGTVLVEAALGGLNQIYGNDLNPLARLIGTAKLQKLAPINLSLRIIELKNRIQSEYALLEFIIQNANAELQNQGYDLTSKDDWGKNAGEILQKYLSEKGAKLNVPNFKNLGYWFKPSAIIELQIIKNCILIEADIDIKNYMFIAMSETIRLVSNRRNGEFKMFRMPAAKVAGFSPNVYNEFCKILDRNVKKMLQYVDYCNTNKINPNISIHNEDAKILSAVPNSSIDVMITSPPYGDSRTTVAYGEFSRLSLQWINLDNLDEKEITGLDRSLMGGQKYRNGFELSIKSETLRTALNQIKDNDLERAGDVYSFYLDLENCIEAISKKMKAGGYQFWVVGNRTVKNINLQTDKIVEEISEQYGLVALHSVARNIPNKVMPSLNSPTNITGEKVKTMCNEHIVILKKIK